MYIILCNLYCTLCKYCTIVSMYRVSIALLYYYVLLNVVCDNTIVSEPCLIILIHKLHGRVRTRLPLGLCHLSSVTGDTTGRLCVGGDLLYIVSFPEFFAIFSAFTMADEYLCNPQWVHRMHEVFASMDLNKNGYLELDDWLTMVRNIERDTKADAALIAKLNEVMHEYCAGMGLTPGKKSTREEFVKDMAAFAASERSKTKAGERPLLFKTNDAWYDVVDTNHDGFVTRDEYRIVMKAGSYSTAAADASFDHIDTNKDGKIERKELYQHEFNFWYELDDPK